MPQEPRAQPRAGSARPCDGNRNSANGLIPAARITGAILLLRGQKVMLDRDLAALYGVENKALKRAVRRNIARFPGDFMFVLDHEELAILRRQIGTSRSWGGERYSPMAFTEQGVAMLSSVLNSERAIMVNIAIMRTFARLRHLLASHADLARKLDEMELSAPGHEFGDVCAYRARTRPRRRPRLFPRSHRGRGPFPACGGSLRTWLRPLDYARAREDDSHLFPSIFLCAERIHKPTTVRTEK